MFLNDDTPTASEWSALDMSGHSSRTGTILLTNGLFVGAVAVVVSMRIFTKVFMTASLFLDDYLMLASTFFFSICCALNLVGTTQGFGRHIWDLTGVSTSSTIEEISMAAARVQKLNFVSLILLSPAIVLAKLSVIAILLRVFPRTMKALRVFFLALAGVIIGCCTTQALLVIFQCSPVQSSWDLEAGSCYINSLENVTISLGALNLVTDLMVCIAPIPYFLRLKIPGPQKLCLCALFLSGLIACATSIVRVTSLRGLNNNVDVTYVTPPYFNWSICETALIIMTGSLPSLRPLLATILPDFFKSSHFSSGWSPEKRTLKSQGTITITKELHIEESDKYYKLGSLTNTPTRPHFTNTPRAIVTCETVSA